jgi:parallel beta-helix repeat protein
MKISKLTLQNIGLPTVFFFYFLFVYFLTVGQLVDTSFLSKAMFPTNQTNASNEANPAVLGSQDDEYEPRLLAQADTDGVLDDNILHVCSSRPNRDACEFFGFDGIQEAVDIAQDGTTIKIDGGISGRVYRYTATNETPTITIDNKSNILIIATFDSYYPMLESETNVFEIYNSSNISIKRMNVSAGNTGFLVDSYSNRITIQRNVVQNMEGNGIEIGYYSNATIADNIIKNNSLNGINIHTDSEVDIVRNEIVNNGNGIFMPSSNEGSMNIEDNTILDNTSAGIYVRLFKGIGTITSNTIEENQFGILIDESILSELSDNTIRNNTDEAISIISASVIDNQQNNTCEPTDTDCNTADDSTQDEAQQEESSPDNEDIRICDKLSGKYTRQIFNNYVLMHFEDDEQFYQCGN